MNLFLIIDGNQKNNMNINNSFSGSARMGNSSEPMEGASWTLRLCDDIMEVISRLSIAINPVLLPQILSDVSVPEAETSDLIYRLSRIKSELCSLESRIRI